MSKHAVSATWICGPIGEDFLAGISCEFVSRNHGREGYGFDYGLHSFVIWKLGLLICGGAHALT